MSELDEKLRSALEEFTTTKKDPAAIGDPQALKVHWFGKEGVFRVLFSGLKKIEGDVRAAFAKQINELRDEVTIFIEEMIATAHRKKIDAEIATEHYDLTLPHREPGSGFEHPVAKVERRIEDVLRQYGFVTVEGPEIEDEYYCFDSLNIPKHHPARDLQDTFYTNDGKVLRTHTSSVQTRVLEKGGLPVKIAAPGRVYRNESVDASHSEMFHQYELLWVEKGLTFAHLLDIITHLLKELYGKRRKVRFVPKYYPYTEPSIGALIHAPSKQGGKEWVTVAGAGMVHPKVLEEFGYDTTKVGGFAFGLGTTRLAVEQFGLPHVSALYENDVRVLGSIL